MDHGHEHLARTIQQPERIGSRVEVDRADDPVRRRLELQVVGDLVDPVRGGLIRAHRRQRGLAGQHEDQVVRIDRLEPRRLLEGFGAVERRPLDLGDLDRFAAVERVGEPSVDGHPPDEAPLLGQGVERDPPPGRGRDRRIGAQGRGHGGPARRWRGDRGGLAGRGRCRGRAGRCLGDRHHRHRVGDDLLALQEVEGHVTPPRFRCATGWSRRPCRRRVSSCRRGPGLRRCRAAAGA